MKKWIVDIPEFHNAKLSIFFKNCDTKEINNYRGIYLLDICSKIISALIGNRLQETLRKHVVTNKMVSLTRKYALTDLSA